MNVSTVWWNVCLHNGFRQTLEIRPRRSGLAFFILIAVACALLALSIADLAPAWRWFLLALVLVVAVARAHAHLGSASVGRVRRAVLTADGRWRVTTASEVVTESALVSCWGSSLGPVIALQWQCADGRRRAAWLFRSQLSAPSWRRLRVRLRLT